MAFFDDLGEKLGSAASATASKAKELAEIAKWNVDIAGEERKMEKALLAIGKIVFEKEKDDPGADIADLCQKVLAAQKQIVVYQQKIKAAKDDDGPKGQPAAPAAPADQKEAVACPRCGTVSADADSKFCSACGAALGQEAETAAVLMEEQAHL